MGINRKTDDEPPADSSRICTLFWNREDEWYLSFGFISVIINSEEGPQCVLCLTIISTDSVKPNKLKWYLETKHSEMRKKPE
jgi:hypothetical protein